jgi:hypothetical protein
MIARGPDQLANVARFITQLAPDKAWRISVTAHKSRRSLEQNDRFHALIGEIADATGNSPRWMKEWVKREFGPVVTVEIDGKVHEMPKPSSDYDVAEMSQVMERLEAWAASELGMLV